MAIGAFWLSLGAPIFQGIPEYVLAPGAPLHWPWNECPSKFVIPSPDGIFQKAWLNEVVLIAP